MALRATRNFGLILAAALALVCGLVLPLLGVLRPAPWPWLAAGLLALAALAAPRVLWPLHVAWMKVGALLGWVNTRLLLGFVFFLVIWPIGLLRRLGGHKLPLERDAALPSYRTESRRAEDRKHFERPY